jgi:hypothetical protein
MAVFKQSFSTGFFNEKMIAGMSMAGQEAAVAGVGANKWAAGLAAMRAQTEAASAAAVKKTSVLSGLGHELAKLAAVYAGFKLFEFVHGILDGAAALHEMSQRTGATVETLSVLKFAGAQAEVSAEQITIGFKGMAISLGNLRDGQEKTVDAYKRLGFTAESFKGLNPDQTFIKLATAIGNMKDQTEQSEVSMRVFGRSGSALLPLLEDIAHKGWGAIREETEKAGGLMTKEMADKADNFTDAMVRLKGSLSVLMVEVLVPILPYLTKFVDGLVAVARAAKDISTSGSWIAGIVKAGFNAGQPTHQPFHEDGGFRGSIGDVSPLMAGLGPLSPPPSKADVADAARKAKAARADYAKQVFGLANMDESMHPADKLAFQGVAATHLALRGGGVGTLSAGIGARHQSADDEFMGGSLDGDLSTLFAQGGDGKTAAGRMSILAAFANEAKRGAVALKVQFAQIGTQLGTTLADGFANAIAAGIRGKNVFKAFGNVIMSGLGSIMGQMGHAMIQQGIILMHLLPFLSNPFSSGPALIAAGIALTALGSTLGGIAGGHGAAAGAAAAGGTTSGTTRPTSRSRPRARAGSRRRSAWAG